MENRTTGWTFLSNHAHVLVCLAADPGARLRDVAANVGITERAVQSIIADLEAAGAITRMREGRRNHYEVHRDMPFRHPLEARCRVADLIDMVQRPPRARRPKSSGGSQRRAKTSQ